MDEQAEHRFQGSKTILMMLQWEIHIIIHLLKLTECTTPRVNTSVNYGHWVIMMCQYKFIGWNKWYYSDAEC